MKEICCIFYCSQLVEISIKFTMPVKYQPLSEKVKQQSNIDSQHSERQSLYLYIATHLKVSVIYFFSRAAQKLTSPKIIRQAHPTHV